MPSPPYQPLYNSIENYFNVVKADLRTDAQGCEGDELA